MSRSVGRVSLLICLGLSFFSAGRAQSAGDVQQWVFPQAAVGPFPPLGTYEIDLRVANRSDLQWTGVLKLLEAKRLDAMSDLLINGSPAPDAANISFGLEPREVKVFSITSDVSQVGVLVIEGSEASDGMLLGQSAASPIEHLIPSFNYRLREPSGALSDLIAVPPAQAAVNLSGVVARSGAEAFEVGVAFLRKSDLTSGDTTLAGTQEEADLDLRLTYTDESGQTQSVTAPFNFAPDEPGLQVAKLTRELFSDISEEFFEGGLLEIHSNAGPLYAVLLGFGIPPDFRDIQNGVAPLFPTPLDFKDPNLKAVLRELLRLGPAAPITFELAQTLTFLDATSRDIQSLKGMESLSNLQTLILDSNAISDLSPLAGLTELEVLFLSFNSIFDLSPLAGLTQLTLLVLDFNPISDLSPLTGLTQLEALTLAGSRSDLSPLAGLTRLEMLYFFDNKISDLSPLAGLTELELLRLGDNVISDLSPLVDSCLGAGDFVDLRENLLDVDDCADLQTLASRVDLQHDVSCSDMPPSSKETRDHESSKAGRSIYEEYRDWIANKGDYKELFPRLKE